MIALGGGLNSVSSSSDSAEENKFSPEMWTEAMAFVERNLVWIIVGVAVAIILILILAAISIWGRAALIKSIDVVMKGGSVAFKAGLREGKKYFWKMFSIGCLLTGFMLVIVIALFAPVGLLVYFKSYSLAALVGLLAVIILIPLMILIAYARIYSAIYVVLADLGVKASLENAYKVFRGNLSASLIMGLIFMACSIAFGLAIFMIIAILGVIFFALGVGLKLAAGTAGIAIAAGLGIFAAALIVLGLRSGWEVFCQIAWILFFQEIAKVKKEELAEEVVVEPLEKKIPEPENA